MNQVIVERLSIYNRIRFRNLVGRFLKKRTQCVEEKLSIMPVIFPTNALLRNANNKKSKSDYRIIPFHYNNCSVDVVVLTENVSFYTMIPIINHLVYSRPTDVLFGFIFYNKFITYEQFFEMAMCINSFTEYINNYLLTIITWLFDVTSSLEEEIFGVTVEIFDGIDSKSIN